MSVQGRLQPSSAFVYCDKSPWFPPNTIDIKNYYYIARRIDILNWHGNKRKNRLRRISFNKGNHTNKIGPSEMSKPTLYGPAYSTYTRSARLAMEEKGVDYDLVEVDFLQGPMPEEQVQRHPFAKVPAFEHNGFELYEVTAIERYIDEGFDGPSLQPESPKERARMNQIISIIDSYTYSCTVGQLVIQRIVMPMLGEQSDESAIAEAMPEISKCMGIIAGLRADSKFLVSERVTLADLHLAPIFDYFQSTPDSDPILQKNSGLRNWWTEINKRESMRKTQFISE
jgi:glutathione S-transferase